MLVYNLDFGARLQANDGLGLLEDPVDLALGLELKYHFVNLKLFEHFDRQCLLTHPLRHNNLPNLLDPPDEYLVHHSRLHHRLHLNLHRRQDIH